MCAVYSGRPNLSPKPAAAVALLLLLLAGSLIASGFLPHHEQAGECGPAGPTYYVAPGGSDTNDGSACHPWATLQHAADKIGPGDTVIAEDGTYVEAINLERGGSSAARVTFLSQTKWGAKITPTLAQMSAHGEIAVNVNAPYVTLQGFDVGGVNPTSATGAHGIKCQANANNCIIAGNHVHDIGVGTVCPSGAAIQSAADTAVITANYVNHNGPPAIAGFACPNMQAIYINGGNGGVIQNNVIVDCVQCAGIQFWGATPDGWTVTNNTLANVGGGMGSGCGFTISCFPPGNCGNNKVNNNIFYNIGGFCLKESGQGTFAASNTYYNNLVNNCDGMHWVNGNTNYTATVTSPPQFVNYTGDASGDYHLLPTSPAINRGTYLGAPNVDYDGVPRPQGAAVDIGAYQHPPQ